MEPTYKSGDILFINNFFYFLSNPQVSDIVVLKDPKTGKLIVKRIAKIKDNTYFLLGDNESESTDSRHFGYVKKKQIVGKVIYKL